MLSWKGAAILALQENSTSRSPPRGLLDFMWRSLQVLALRAYRFQYSEFCSAIEPPQVTASRCVRAGLTRRPSNVAEPCVILTFRYALHECEVCNIYECPELPAGRVI